jgi:hypothetical protein
MENDIYQIFINFLELNYYENYFIYDNNNNNNNENENLFIIKLIWRSFGYFSNSKKYRYWLLENGIITQINKFFSYGFKFGFGLKFENITDFNKKILREISFVILNLTNIITSEKNEFFSSGLFEKLLEFLIKYENKYQNKNIEQDQDHNFTIVIIILYYIISYYIILYFCNNYI